MACKVCSIVYTLPLWHVPATGVDDSFVSVEVTVPRKCIKIAASMTGHASMEQPPFHKKEGSMVGVHRLLGVQLSHFGLCCSPHSIARVRHWS